MASTCAVFDAVVTAVPRFPIDAELASRSRMLHVEQIADAACRSRSISFDQPASAAGSEVPPVWFVFVKQGLLAALVRAVSWASVQLWMAGRPWSVRNLVRFAKAAGSSYASTIAMTRDGSPCALMP